MHNPNTKHKRTDTERDGGRVSCLVDSCSTWWMSRCRPESPSSGSTQTATDSACSSRSAAAHVYTDNIDDTTTAGPSPPNLLVATYQMWCLSVGRGRVTELSLCIVHCNVYCYIIMLHNSTSSSNRSVVDMIILISLSRALSARASVLLHLWN